MEIIIIDYGVGNIGSIVNMFKRIGVKATLSSDETQIMQANKLLLPGVGSFDKGMLNLQHSGLMNVLERKVVEQKTPILGICLGMQLLFEKSEEGELPGLRWIAGEVRRFDFKSQSALRVPQMGWNEIRATDYNSLFYGLEIEARFYFAHSYYVECREAAEILATTEYGGAFVSAVNKGNIWGVQFHPEKSHRFGLQLLKNFIERT